MYSTTSLRRAGMILVMTLLSFSVTANEAQDNDLLAVSFLNQVRPIHIEPIKLPLDPKEIECLALNIYFEARNEPYDGKLAVAQVTRNRVESERFPNTYCGVVWQQTKNRNTGKKVAQFSWTLDGKPDNPYNQNMFEVAYEVAEEVLRYGKKSGIIESNVFNYHAVYVKPAWARQMRKVARIGNHVFYKHN